MIILGILLICSCQEKSPNKPANENSYPQVDIPWPSLADSPWPIAHGNMQCTGRSRYQGPRQGAIEWKFPREGHYLKENNGSAVIGKDGTIYFTTSHVLFAVNPDGAEKWRFTTEQYMSGSPMVGAEDIIYVGTGKDDKGCYYAIDNEGNVIWEFQAQENLYSYADAIGLDGTIYFTGAEGTLYALNPNGSLKWQSKGMNGFSYGHYSIAMSHDGSVLYVIGSDNSLNAVDAQTSSITWRYFKGKNFYYANHMVDCEGDIYLYAAEGEKHVIVSLYPSGEERWKFQLDSLDSSEPTSDIHMDKDGNIYFCLGNNFASLDYHGNLRWAITFKGQSPTGAIVGDMDGYIYFGWDYLFAYNQKGNKQFEYNLKHVLVLGAISDNNRIYVCAEPYFYCVK